MQGVGVLGSSGGQRYYAEPLAHRFALTDGVVGIICDEARQRNE